MNLILKTNIIIILKKPYEIKYLSIIEIIYIYSYYLKSNYLSMNFLFNILLLFPLSFNILE